MKVDQFFQKVQNVASEAGKKTSEMVGLSKLKLQEVQLNGELNKLYEKLGGIVYTTRKNGADAAGLIDACIGEIDAVCARMKELEERISEMKRIVRCPSCGAVNVIDAVYCSRCGRRLSKGEAAHTEAAQAEQAPDEFIADRYISDRTAAGGEDRGQE